MLADCGRFIWFGTWGLFGGFVGLGCLRAVSG